MGDLHTGEVEGTGVIAKPLGIIFSGVVMIMDLEAIRMSMLCLIHYITIEEARGIQKNFFTCLPKDSVGAIYKGCIHFPGELKLVVCGSGNEKVRW